MVENVQQIVSTPADQSKPLPGEVREELKITFSATLDRMETLIGKVQVLAVQAENYFWSHRSTALRSVLTGENGDADMLDDCVTGAEKLCLAAYPMLNEITERLHYISGVAAAYVDVGEDTGEHSWDIANDGAAATRTFYMPTVREVCATLNSYVAQMRDWSDNAEGWQDEGTSSIRQMYGAALLELYARTRQVIDLLGPLFPPVICNYFPRVTTPDGITGNTENFLPTECRFVKKDTQSIEIALYAGAYQVPFSAAIGSGYADWFNTPTVVSNGEKVYPRRGGIISVEQMTLEDSADDLTGVYEIYECADNLVISNEDLISEAYESQILDNIYGTTFKMRLIRKAEEDTSGVIHVQYRTDIDDLDVDEGHFEQEFSWEFDATGVNEHVTPEAKDRYGGLFVWERFDSTINSDQYQRGVTISNLTKDTLFMGKVIEYLGIKGVVSAFATDATYLYIGGDFDEVYGRAINNLARIALATGVLDDAWLPEPNGRVNALIVDGSNLFVGGHFSKIYNCDTPSVQQNRLYLAKFNSSGVLQSWAPNPNGVVYALEADSSDNIYVGGYFTTISSISRSNLAMYSSSGVLQSWAPNPNSIVLALEADSSDNIYVGGYFTTISSTSRSHLAMYSSSGVLQSWAPNPNGVVYALEADSSDNIYVGGYFTTISSISRSNLAMYSSSGVLQSWAPNPNGVVYALKADSSDNIYVGGDFTTISSTSRSHLAMYSSSGVLQSWAPNPNHRVGALEADSSDNIYVGGSFLKPYSGAFVYLESLEQPIPGWTPTTP